VRRRTIREGGEARLAEVADEYFGMPQTSLPFAAQLPAPLYVPARSANS
jgi:hypothetical protein